MSPELFGNPSTLKGMKGAVIFFYGSRPDEKQRYFFPIREVEIEDVESLGDILYIRFKTGRLYEQTSRNASPHPSPESSVIENALKPFLQAAYPSLTRYVVVDDLILIKLAHDELLAWSNLVQSIGDLVPFEGVSFLKVVRIADQNGKPVNPKILVSKKGKIVTRGYALRGGSTYQLELLQRTNDKMRLVQPFEIKLKAPESIVPIHSAVVVGEYDKLELTFSVKPQLNNLYSSVGVRADVEPNGLIIGKPDGVVSVKVVSPNILLPIRVGRISYALPIGLISSGIVIGPFAAVLNKFGVLAITDVYQSIVTALGLLLVAGGISVFRKTM